MKLRGRMLVLPGMGATSAMYSGPWRQLEDAVFLDWPVVAAGEVITLASIASDLVDEYEIAPGDLLVGSSLGGIVAQEIAAQVGVAEIVLVGSARTRLEIQPILLKLAGLSEWAPLSVIQLLAGKSSAPLSQMFAEVDVQFVRGACLALSEWEPPVLPGVRIHRIHGVNDPVIRCPGAGVRRIEGAGHVIAMTHPDECVGFVKGVI